MMLFILQSAMSKGMTLRPLISVHVSWLVHCIIDVAQACEPRGKCRLTPHPDGAIALGNYNDQCSNNIFNSCPSFLIHATSPLSLILAQSSVRYIFYFIQVSVTPHSCVELFVWPIPRKNRTEQSRSAADVEDTTLLCR